MDQFILIWLCPVNVTGPSAEDQAALCIILLDIKLVDTCKPPNGEEMTTPTIPPLTDARYNYNIIYTEGTIIL